MILRISQRDAENIIIAMMQWRNRDGKITNWGADLQLQMAQALINDGRVVIEIDSALTNTTTIPLGASS